MARVKICGFTVRKDIEDALALGIKIIGINFFDGSPRYVPPAKAKMLLSGLPGDIVVIGVFVNPDEKILLHTASVLNLSGVQLHGDENEDFLDRMRKRLKGTLIFKGIRVRDPVTLSRAIERYTPDFFLLDAFTEKAKGGTGERIDRNLLRDSAVPWNKTFLAGGITPGNVRGLLREFNPYGIDVASGVETSPGKKNTQKIRLLLENMKNENPTS